MMSPHTKTALFSFFALSLIAGVSYSNFVTFNPKLLVPLKEVRGVNTKTDEIQSNFYIGQNESKVEVNIPYPANSEILGVVKTERDEQHTIKSPLTPNEVQEFYKNVLKSQSWELTNENTTGIFSNTEYKKEKARIKITASENILENTKTTNEINAVKETTYESKSIFSIVSIEINQRN